jgi:Rrf2 family protein
MRLQISSQLAIFALVELARTPDRQRSVAEIGAIYDVSPHHLAKVMKALVRAGYAQSVRGVGGGYRLACNPRRVTLLDVVMLVEEMGTAGPDPFGPTPTGRVLASIMAEIDDITRATLGTITLATMIRLIESEARAGARRQEPPAADGALPDAAPSPDEAPAATGQRYSAE